MLKKLLLDSHASAENHQYQEKASTSSKNEGLQGQHAKISHCRFCAQEMKYGDLVDLSTDKERMELCLLVLEFFKIDFINFSNNKIPKTICQSCYNMIKTCYRFFQTAKESQITLNGLYCVKMEQPNEDVIEVNIQMDIEAIDNIDGKEGIIVKTRRSSDNSDISPPVVQKSESEYQSNAGINFGYFNEISQMYGNTSTYDISTANTSSANLEDGGGCYSSTTIYGNTSTYGIPTADTSYNSANVEDSSSCDSSMIMPQYYMTGPTVSDSLNSDSNEETVKKRTSRVVNIKKVWNGGSWKMYPWSCKHCRIFDSMDEIRSHSLQQHKICFAFRCADCPKEIQINMFSTFVEHVRQHREDLNYYCPYCNEHFASEVDCTNHTLTHWSGGKGICEMCGQIFPDAAALKLHKSISRRDKIRVVSSVKKEATGTWADYEWTCQECSLKFSDAQSLRMHSQEVHNKCFTMKCADCVKVSFGYRFFVSHVVRHHRPHLKKYCSYCNEYIEDASQLKKHEDDHFTGPQRPCDGCGQIFENKHVETEHYNKFQPARRTRYLTTEDLTCDICQSVFNTLGILKRHKMIHENREREHVCPTCGKGFLNENTLKYHQATHGNRDKVCKVCNLTFVTKRRLKAHVSTHLEKQFFCDNCSRGFVTKSHLMRHIFKAHVTHADRKFKCLLCNKQFNTSTGLRTHMNVHSGARPYQCQNCDKTFTNWGNCNKHMIRIHNTTLAKSKITSRGKIPINSVEKVENIESDTVEWIQNVLNSKAERDQ